MTLTVAIDPGHPSHKGDTGAVSVDGRILESDYTIHIARMLLRHLQCIDEALDVHLLRTVNDEVVSIAERAMKADALDADLVVSVHVDSALDKSYRGAHAIYWPTNKDGKAVADVVADSFPPALRARPSPATTELWPRAVNVVGAYPMTCVLVECGYASNLGDVEALVEPTVQDQIVGALAQGVRHFRQRREAHWLKE